MSRSNKQSTHHDWSQDDISLFSSPAWSVKFLKSFRPSGPWVLSAIYEGSAPETVTFHAGQEDAMQAWIEKRQAQFHNLYFNPAETKGPVSKKTSKGDMACSWWLWAEIDLLEGTDHTNAALVQAAKNAIVKRLKAVEGPYYWGGLTLPPSIIIDSGGGIHAYWHLELPHSLETAEDYEVFETINQAIGKAFTADNCFNCDRIMRLPWTTNFPDAGKRSKGRRATCASIVEFDETRVYDFEEIKAQVEELAAKEGTARERREKAKAARAELAGWQELDGEALYNGLD
ncbi:MAG: hypothetical protein WBX25_31675 [Rhodomicrobium sp.]